MSLHPQTQQSLSAFLGTWWPNWMVGKTGSQRQQWLP